MSIFAGVVSTGEHSIIPGKAELMLSHVVAPYNRTLRQYCDDVVDVALLGRKEGHGFFSSANFVVVADCRFNSTERLCSKLGLPNSHDFPAKILVEAYEKWGDSLVEHLSGEFAFAIWDKTDQSLLCGRDRFGRVPFAYLITPSGIEFASDFHSIAAEQSTPLRVNEDWIIEYSMGVVADASTTPFEGLMRLPPGCVMKWRDSQLKIVQYWSFQDIERSSAGVSISSLTQALENSVADRIENTQTLAMLSGGLDSSSIAILARDQFQRRFDQPIHSMSMDSDDPVENSEKHFIDAVLKDGGFAPHIILIENYGALAEIERLVNVQGAPIHARGAPIFNQALDQVRHLGFTSVLDGHGGDEIISSFGVMRLFELARDRKWLSLLIELIRVSRVSDLPVLQNFAGLYSTRGSGITAGVFRRLNSLLKAPRAPADDSLLLKHEWKTHPAFDRSVNIIKGTNPSRYKNERDYQESILRAPLQSQAHEILYRQYRSYGLRPHFPFWDERVVEQCLRTPSHEKLKKGIPRSLIRTVMGERLPREVSKRTTKFDFSGYLVRSLQSDIDRLKHISSDQNHQVFDYVDHDVFEKAIDDLQHDHRPSNLNAALKLWPALNIFVWLNLVNSFDASKNNALELPC